MRLPIPIFKKDKTYKEIELKKPDSKDTADAHDLLEKTRDEYAALHRLVVGSVKSIKGEGYEIDDPLQIREVTKKMAYRSAEYVAIKGLLLLAKDDGVDGIYPCPRNGCEGSHMARIEYDSDNEESINTLDYVSDFEEIFLEEDDGQLIHHDLQYPVDLGNDLEIISSLTLIYPTLQNCMSARSRVATGNSAKMNMTIYADSIIKVNGKEPDEGISKWRNRFAITVMGKLDVKDDLAVIYKKARKYGYETAKDRFCNDCGNQWKERVNPMGFFNSALREVA